MTGRRTWVSVARRGARELGRLVRLLPGFQALRRAAHEAEFAQGRPSNGYRGVYASHEEALRAVPRGRASGYDHPVMGTYYRERLGGPILQDYAAYFWLREALKSSSRLFDFGGHVGIAYHASRRHLALPDGFVWQVCDLPSIVEAGTALARELDSEHLRFTTDPDEARGADVIYASGSLQYMEEGFLHGLIERVGERASHLIVQSTPLHPERSFVTLQATGHAFCPYTVAQRGSFVEGLQRLGFRLVDEWRIPRELEVPFHDGYRLDAYSGLYFTRA